MEFRILGSVEALRDRRSVNLGGVQTRRLLGLLLAHSGDVVVPDRIIDALWWSVDPPSSPERTVQSYVSRLRGSLGDGWVTRRAGGYLIEASRSAFDARLFAEAVKSSRGRPPAEKLATLATALEKWRGVPFGEFSEEPWAVGPVRRLRDLRATALENVFAARISLDGHREVVGDLEAAVAEYPEHAELVGQLMVALADPGHTQQHFGRSIYIGGYWPTSPVSILRPSSSIWNGRFSRMTLRSAWVTISRRYADMN